MTGCIVILNYNGLEHLEACLSSALRAASRPSTPWAVVLVDNVSTDGSVDYVRQHFPEVEVVVSEANDFLFSLNPAVQRRSEDWVVLLNNDMRCEEDFLEPLIEHFDDPQVFAVGAAIMDWEGVKHTTWPRSASLRRSWFYWNDIDAQKTRTSLLACAGAAVFRREMFVALGGFDPLYRPGYYEDLDLSYRGWEQGWKVMYEPRSRVYHKGSASMLKRFGPSKVDILLFRNYVLFMCKNIAGPAFLTGFLLLLPMRMVRPLLQGDFVPFLGIPAALPRIYRAIRSRLGKRPVPRHSTASVVELIRNGAQ